MAEMPVRLGPSFGGITRIRFKGFDRLSPIISARRLPRTGSRIKRRGAKSTARRHLLIWFGVSHKRPVRSAVPRLQKRRRHACLYRRCAYGTITADASDAVGLGVRAGVGEGSSVVCALEGCRR